MDEITQLRSLLEAQCRRCEEAEGRALHEKRRREEAEDLALHQKRRREEAEQAAAESQPRTVTPYLEDCHSLSLGIQIAEGRALHEKRRREEAEDLALHEKRRREEAEDLALHQKRRREEAEQAAAESQPRTVTPYLEDCHSLSLGIQIVTDVSKTTQGDTTNPTGRLYPKRITPWTSFPATQEEIWDILSEPPFVSQQSFPSRHQIDYVRSVNFPISCENGVRYFERETVENPVQKLVQAVFNNPRLRSRLGLRGIVTFQSHTNLGKWDDNFSASLEPMPLTDDAAGEEPLPPTKLSRKPKPKPKGKGKGNRADQFCIYRTSDGVSIPTVAIEYKAPHKLRLDDVVTGLASEIQPDRDIINKDGEDFKFISRRLLAAVVTQLFSYMIGNNTQYGYVCTGQAFVFLHIPVDPTTVYYHVCVPNLDVLADDNNRLHRTAVAQVFAFTLQALRSAQPSLFWQDAAARLDIWDVEFEDILSKIPETVRKTKTPLGTPYKPQRWKGFQRSRIRTRSGCQALSGKALPRDDDDDDEEESAPSSPTWHRSTCSGVKVAASGTTSDQKQRQGAKSGKGAHVSIQNRPYCTHQCLLGLAHGGQLDKNCPNADSHGPRHLGRLRFLRLLRAQLAVDRGHDADSAPLYLCGAVGSLFKVRLSAFGYTLVAKGVETPELSRLEHEKGVYDQLRSIQGRHVPVCLGMIDLVLPYYFAGGEFEHFLFLSWAGRPLRDCVGEINKSSIIDATTAAFTEIHRLYILHGDAEARNMVYDRGLMIVDFERAKKIPRREPLCPIGSNGHSRKRKRNAAQKQSSDSLAVELQSVVESVSRFISRLQ